VALISVAFLASHRRKLQGYPHSDSASLSQADTLFADLRRDDQAELTLLTIYIPTWFTYPQTVTHPSTNRARCRSTTGTLIATNALPHNQTVTSSPSAVTSLFLPFALRRHVVGIENMMRFYITIVNQLRMFLAYLCSPKSSSEHA